MDLKSIMNGLNLAPSSDEMLVLKNNEKMVVKAIQAEIKKSKLKAEVFTGGSFAKGTLLKQDGFDIDVFVRFPAGKKEISHSLGKILEKVSKLIGYSVNRVHGSRDYFRLEKENLIFEIIPVRKIRKPEEEENVTDLSYFHVSYMKKKLNTKLVNEIRLLKAFLKAHNLYGAESYVRGISGYGAECLILYYKSFLKMCKEIIKSKDTIYIDIEKHYKNKQTAFIELNESKLSPIVLIDPTWKERNVLAALSKESFDKLKSVVSDFIKKPNIDQFKEKDFDEKDFISVKNKNVEGIKMTLRTDKQPGDIAGTKMKKFSNLVFREIGEYFFIDKWEFDYQGEDTSKIYCMLRSKGEIIRRGPPLSMKENVAAFLKRHSKTITKENSIWAVIKLEKKAKDFLNQWKKENSSKIKEMDIEDMIIDSI